VHLQSEQTTSPKKEQTEGTWARNWTSACSLGWRVGFRVLVQANCENKGISRDKIDFFMNYGS